MQVIDSHTGGQPTRVIIDGGPDLGSGPLAERKALFAERFDDFRLKSVLEPKCSDAMVGALLCQPFSQNCCAGVIFFNNAGYLDMCGHGTIGLAVTLAHLGRLDIGEHFVETPVGIVKIELLTPNEASVTNVPSYCLKKNVSLDVDGVGLVTGNIAWGGNWFFLIEDAPVPLRRGNIPTLTGIATRIKNALVEQSICGAEGAEIDHIEFFEPGSTPGVDSRNFVLCPSLAYDRSPCGTGTSAKLACLAEAGKLEPGQIWVQESIVGSRFHASYQYDDLDQLIPTITGQAHVYGNTQLIFQPGDPFEHGFG